MKLNDFLNLYVDEDEPIKVVFEDTDGYTIYENVDFFYSNRAVGEQEEMDRVFAEESDLYYVWHISPATDIHDCPYLLISVENYEKK